MVIELKSSWLDDNFTLEGVLPGGGGQTGGNKISNIIRGINQMAEWLIPWSHTNKRLIHGIVQHGDGYEEEYQHWQPQER